MRANHKSLPVIVAACAVLCVLAVPRRVRAVDPCCTITAIDQNAGVVTAKENATGRVFTFQVRDAKTLRSIRIGQGVYANFTSRQVSLDGIAPCCAIASLAAGSSAPSAGTPVPRVLAPSAAPYLAHDVRILGVYSPAAENMNDESDPMPSGIPVTRKVPLIAAAVNLASTKHLLSTDQGRQAIQQAASRLGGLQMHLALLAGHKYMITDCLGVKASAGNFDVSIPAPQVSFGTTSATIRFLVSHVTLNVLTIRLRPDLTDAIHPCHFSGRVGVGGSADNLAYSMTLDPLYNLQSCKVSNMNVLSSEWSIGSFSVAPIPSQVTGNAKDMVVDALNYFTSFGVGDTLTQSLQDVVAQSVCRTLSQ